MPDSSFPQDCCHCDDRTYAPCPDEAVYRTWYKGVEVTFCELHYSLWIVIPLLEGTLEAELVSRVAPVREVTP